MSNTIIIIGILINRTHENKALWELKGLLETKKYKTCWCRKHKCVFNIQCITFVIDYKKKLRNTYFYYH